MAEGDSIEIVRWQEGCLVESGWKKPGAKGDSECTLFKRCAKLTIMVFNFGTVLFSGNASSQFMMRPVTELNFLISLPNELPKPLKLPRCHYN